MLNHTLPTGGNIPASPMDATLREAAGLAPSFDADFLFGAFVSYANNNVNPLTTYGPWRPGDAPYWALTDGVMGVLDSAMEETHPTSTIYTPDPFNGLTENEIRSLDDSARQSLIANARQNSRPVGLWGTARIGRTFREWRYKQRKVTVSFASRAGKAFTPITMSMRDFFARFAHADDVAGVFIPGDMVPGERSRNTVKDIHFLCVTIEGHDCDAVDEWLAMQKFAAIRQTISVSDETQINKDELAQFAPGEDVTDPKVIWRYLWTVRGFTSDVRDTISFARTEHSRSGNGIVVVAKHAKVGKHLIIVPIDPFSVANEGETQKAAIDKFIKLRQAFADEYGFLCESAKIEDCYPLTDGDCTIFGGKVFEWRSFLESQERKDARGKAQETFEPELKAWEKAIDSLHSGSTTTELKAVLTKVSNAVLDAYTEDKALEAVRKKAKAKAETIRVMYQAIKFPPENESTSASYSPFGARIVYSDGKVDFTKISAIVKAEWLKANKDAGYPLLCHYQSVPGLLDLEAPDGKYFTPLTVDAFWSACTSRVILNDKFGVHSSIPYEISKFLYHQGQEWLPEKPQIRDTPCALKDGTILDEPGYHYDLAQGKNHIIQVKDGEGFNVPESPTHADAVAAVDWLRTELLSDFAFLDTNSKGVMGREVGEAHSLALILTPWLRPMISGVTPMHLIHKATPGEGATLLAHIAGYLFTGFSPEVISYRDDAELSKEMVAAIAEGRSVMFFDDVISVDSKVYHRNINYPTLSGRLLGQSKTITVPNDKLWIASGINPRFGKETERRMVSIRLNSQTIDPENRKFRHPDTSGMTMDEFITENRAVAVSHILTLIRYWVQRKKPESKIAKKSNFEDWARKMGGLLELVGVAGFLDHGKTTARDTQQAAFNVFANSSVEKFGMDTKIPYSELFAFHRDIEHNPVFAGKKQWDWEDHFRWVLGRINGKAFKIGVDTVIFESTFDGNGSEFLMFRKKAV